MFLNALLLWTNRKGQYLGPNRSKIMFQVATGHCLLQKNLGGSCLSCAQKKVKGFVRVKLLYIILLQYLSAFGEVWQCFLFVVKIEHSTKFPKNLQPRSKNSSFHDCSQYFMTVLILWHSFCSQKNASHPSRFQALLPTLCNH